MTDTTTPMVHVFEAAGLGKGPFKLKSVTAEGGHCEFCNTAIVFRFYIKGQDTRVFFVGSDCVMKTGDVGLMRVVEAEVKKRQAELRAKRDAEKMAAIKDRLADPAVIAELSAKPHPHSWYAKQGKTMKDYIDYIMRYGGKTARVALAKTLLPAKVKASQPTSATV